MPKGRYPLLEIDLGKLKENLEWISAAGVIGGVKIAGVIKGVNALPEITQVFLESNIDEVASSRINQLKAVKKLRMEKGLHKPLMLLRVPMLSEVKDVVKYAEISLNSEGKVLEALDKEAGKQGKVHRVILMADVGDLREGFWDKEELIETACLVEEKENLFLEGIGTNVGCYGSLVPTAEKLGELIPIAREIERRIGRKLDTISGGASTSFMRITDKDMPEGINHLRMGENILLARDNQVFHGHDTSPLHQDVFTLKAEIIEIKDKPSHPVGEINVDAFGNRPTYEDRGIRKRALIAVGKEDIGGSFEIFPRMEGVEVVGGSSDHTILDITEVKKLKVGDVLEFDIDYVSMLYLTNSKDIRIVYK